jgi:hypothetical protein
MMVLPLLATRRCGHHQSGLLPSSQTLVAPIARKRWQAPRGAQPSESGGVRERLATVAGIARDKKEPLFHGMGKGDRLGDKAMSRFDVLHMIKRRAEAAGLP